MLKRIRQMNGHDAYALVDRWTDPYGIYLSTLMICEMCDAEDEENECTGDEHRPKTAKAIPSEVVQRHTMFLAIKLVHEISHLINYAVNTLFVVDYVVLTPQKKKIKGKLFDDIGDMMEFSLFGGVFEHFQKPSPNAFAISKLLRYDFKGAKKGNIVLVQENIAFLQISTPQQQCTEETLNLKFDEFILKLSI
jgi:hypothetical protein